MDRSKQRHAKSRVCASAERVASNNADISPTGAGNHLANAPTPSFQDLSDAPTLIGEGRGVEGRANRSKLARKKLRPGNEKGIQTNITGMGTTTAATAHPLAGHTALHDPKSPTASLVRSNWNSSLSFSPPYNPSKPGRTAPHRRRLRAMYLNCMYKPPLPKRPLHPDCGSPTLVTFNHWRTAKQQSRYESLATKGNSTLSLTNLPPSSSHPLEMEEQWVGGEGGRKQETTPLWTLGAGTTVFYIGRLDKDGA
ncbi:hypothetical protein B9Z19DRAFT_1066065 [Tuber borchii]|uniref:Uncharacterized protein n=1 Tax=Tuber borchii TaxID=42251 RepID=A0A2T6ZNT7_TUBBO|nr:hypothetical protein B9Z19DRAFT_1066065 [Tuber borchii]